MVQILADHFAERFDIHYRLRNKISEAEADGAGALRTVGRQGDNRHYWIDLTNTPKDLISVHFRHQQIQQDKGKSAATQILQKLLAGIERLDLGDATQV